MKASEIFDICLKRLSLTPEQNGEELYKSLASKAVEFINDIYLDLFKISKSQNYMPIDSLSGQIHLDEKCKNALVYGVCALLSLQAHNTEDYNLYISLYNSQRLRFSCTESKKEIV